jgi:hypothetical protein
MSRVYVLHGRQCEIVEVGLELTIGRSYSNRLRLEGGDISRAHAIIYRRGDEFVLRDLDSKNGVSVNGQNKSKHVLKAGDTLSIGTYILLFDPTEPVDLSKWLPSAEESDERRASFDTEVQQRHQHCPLSTIEKSFSENQLTDDISIPKAAGPLRFAFQAITRLGDENDRDEVCQRALDWAVECFAVQRGIVALAEGDDTKPRTVAMYDANKKGEILIHQRILEWLFERGEALISVKEPDGAIAKGGHDGGGAHRIAMPLNPDGEVRGFIYLENDPPAPPFTCDDLQQLFCIALVTSRRLEEMGKRTDLI